MADEKLFIEALRELVGVMYRDLHGAYGTECYEGQYEREIKEVVDTLQTYLDRVIKQTKET